MPSQFRWRILRAAWRRDQAGLFVRIRM